MTALLDASAVLAVIIEESGAENVEKALDDAAISAVNAAEWWRGKARPTHQYYLHISSLVS